MPARYNDAHIDADIPIIFTTNKRPVRLFPRAPDRRTRDAIKRRYESVEITTPLQVLGRPFNRAEKRARREAGRNGPRGPAAP